MYLKMSPVFLSFVNRKLNETKFSFVICPSLFLIYSYKPSQIRSCEETVIEVPLPLLVVYDFNYFNYESVYLYNTDLMFFSDYSTINAICMERNSENLFCPTGHLSHRQIKILYTFFEILYFYFFNFTLLCLVFSFHIPHLLRLRKIGGF